MSRTRSVAIAAMLAATTLFPGAMFAQEMAAAQGGISPAVTRGLMPLPSQMQAGSGSYTFAPGATVAVTGTHTPRLQAAVLRAFKRLEDKTGVPLPRAIGDATSGTISIAVAGDGGNPQTVEENESYSLVVNESGIRIEAATTPGAIHALETLIQLAQPNGTHYSIPAITIHDSPRFQWRGLMIDCGRHFEPINVLERNIDAMAAVKLNVFHWHLTEDQGFRMESKVFPKLTSVGSDTFYYTQEQARELVQYARDRGIRVVPEFEMPGHSAAWLYAYPELASGTVPTGVRREFGISNTAIDPTREETYVFIARFLKEMTAIFPDQYVHIGGDETPAPDWKNNPKIVAFMKAHNLKDNGALQAYFNSRVNVILTKLGKRMEGWDEILNPALPKDVVIQSWRGEESLIKGAQEGYTGILSKGYYLDAMEPAGKHYLVDPVPSNTDLTPAQQKLILGGEVCMWGEHIWSQTIDSRIWPRTAAMAERFWSPQNVRDVDDMYRRLTPVSVEIESVGAHNLSSEDQGLRELVGREHIEALRDFAQAFEPVPFHQRYQQQKTSQLTPLTEFVDAVRPDPPSRHDVELLTTVMLHDPAHASVAAAALTDYFTRVKASLPEVQHEMANAPRLQSMQTRAEQLGPLCDTALEAVKVLGSGGQLTEAWKTRAVQQITEAQKPSAIVQFTFLDALQQMVDAAR